MFQGFPDDWGAVVERYWLSSKGVAIFIEDDIPLFVNHQDSSKICLKSSSLTAPYLYTPVYAGDIFEYKLCSGKKLQTIIGFRLNQYLFLLTT